MSKKKDNELNNLEWLKSQCNRYHNNYCAILSCLRRGGYKRKPAIVDYDMATCNAHEIINKLENID